MTLTVLNLPIDPFGLLCVINTKCSTKWLFSENQLFAIHHKDLALFLIHYKGTFQTSVEEENSEKLQIVPNVNANWIFKYFNTKQQYKVK